MDSAKRILSGMNKPSNENVVKELTWECIKGVEDNFQGIAFVHRGCGVIEPMQSPTGRYIRRTCACEQHAQQVARDKRERDMWMMHTGNKVFDWVGGHWSDKELRKKTFATFDQQRQPEAFETARLFASLLKGAFILHGTYGTGKTHLLAAICNELINQQKASHFITAPKLFAALQTYIQFHDDYHSIVRQAIHTPLLVIDDVDKAKHTDFREEIYFEIVDERVKRGLPIAISTNRLSDLEQFVGGAVCSRLSIGQIAIEMSGADYRLEL
jgi:DNA replication protein DnaC